MPFIYYQERLEAFVQTSNDFVSDLTDPLIVLVTATSDLLCYAEYLLKRL